MCVGVPCRIVEIVGDQMAIVEVGGARRTVGLHLLDDAAPGEYVLVHAGFAVGKLHEEEALETLAMLEAFFGGPIIDQAPESPDGGEVLS